MLQSDKDMIKDFLKTNQPSVKTNFKEPFPTSNTTKPEISHKANEGESVWAIKPKKAAL